MKHLLDSYVNTVHHTNCTIEVKHPKRDGNKRYTINSCCGDGLREVLAQLIYVHKIDLKVINFMNMGDTYDDVSFFNEDGRDCLQDNLMVYCPDTTYFITGVVLTKIHN